MPKTKPRKQKIPASKQPRSAVAKKPATPWSTSQLSRNVFRVEVPFQYGHGWEQWALITSDIHWDNPHCDRKLLKKHLDLAVEREAIIFSNGDMLDLMGGKYDPRAVKSGIRSEHNVAHYFDAVVEDAAEWFSPYAQNLFVLAQGNHETAMASRHEFSPIERLVTLLNSKTRSRVYNGGYSGWMEFSFAGSSAKRTSGRARNSIVTVNYHHGSSSGKSTSNILSHEKRAAFLPDADLLLTGHAHNFWCEIVARLRLGRGGAVYHDTQVHLGCPGYKNDTGDGSEGWGNEKGFRPKPLGAWWVRFFWSREQSAVLFEAIRAQ